MVALYITSLAEGAGKTMIGAGLGKHLMDDGRKVGFFKPVVADGNRMPGEKVASDATFMKHVFELDEPVELLAPVFTDEKSLLSGIKEAYARIAGNKDVVIVEGGVSQKQTSLKMVEALGAKVIIVGNYTRQLSGNVEKYKEFGKHLLGVVLNKVPKTQIENARSEIAGFQNAGIDVLGILPENRALWTLTVGELAAQIQGEIVRGADRTGELVENIMLGAMGVDPGRDYFDRRANKAVILKSERPDMQIAALETSTRCLVLAGKTAPIDAVLFRAEEKKVPVILAKEDVATITTRIESALEKTSFNQASKLAELSVMMAKNFNIPALHKGLF